MQRHRFITKRFSTFIALLLAVGAAFAWDAGQKANTYFDSPNGQAIERDTLNWTRFFPALTPFLMPAGSPSAPATRLAAFSSRSSSARWAASGRA